MKTTELSGVALDWAVAKCEGYAPFTDGISWIIDSAGAYEQLPRYSTNWSQGGPIIERDVICLTHSKYDCWTATGQDSTDLDAPLYQEDGPTPLIAAMRCFVASKLGDEVELPKELE